MGAVMLADIGVIYLSFIKNLISFLNYAKISSSNFLISKKYTIIPVAYLKFHLNALLLSQCIFILGDDITLWI